MKGFQVTDKIVEGWCAADDITKGSGVTDDL
jgi:hypothetical protein